MPLRESQHTSNTPQKPHGLLVKLQTFAQYPGFLVLYTRSVIGVRGKPEQELLTI